MQRVSTVLSGVRAVARCQQKRAGSGGNWLSKKEREIQNKTMMDFLPKPEGSWEAGYKAYSNKANMALGGSLLAFALTVVYMERVGCFDLLQNPAYWSDKQVERQRVYYEKGNPWRKPVEEDEDDE